MDLINESNRILKNRKSAIKELGIGTKIRIIEAGSGAGGCNDCIGLISNRESNNGLCSYDKGINVEIIDTINKTYPIKGSVWKVSLDCKFKVLTN